MEAMGRQPEILPKLQVANDHGFGFAEALTIYAFVTMFFLQVASAEPPSPRVLPAAAVLAREASWISSFTSISSSRTRSASSFFSSSSAARSTRSSFPHARAPERIRAEFERIEQEKAESRKSVSSTRGI